MVVFAIGVEHALTTALVNRGLRVARASVFSAPAPGQSPARLLPRPRVWWQFAPYGNACVERDRPFPHVPSNALNDAILDAAIFHVVKHTFDLCPLCLRPSVRAALSPGLSEQLFAHEISPVRKVEL